MMLGDKIPAQEAERIGMIYKVFPDDNFSVEAFKIAVQLAKMPTKALAYTKQALNLSVDNSFEEQLLDEDILQQRASQTSDYKEGVQSFIEKRVADFKGD